MTVQFLHKRSNVPGLIPSLESLELGELALNTIDGKLFFKKFDNLQESIVTIDPNLVIKQVNKNNQVVDSKSFNYINNINVDLDSGLVVDDLGTGTVKFRLNGFFKSWHVPGQAPLSPDGVDDITVKAGNGIILTTNTDDCPYQSLTISTPLKTVQLFQEGLLRNTGGTIRWYAPGEVFIKKIVVRISQAADTDIQINVLKSSLIQEVLTLIAGSDKIELDTDFSMVTDDYLTVDLLTNNNSTGSGLNIEFSYSYKPSFTPDPDEVFVPNGLENLNLISGNGIVLTTNNNDFPYPSIVISTPLKTVQLFQDGIITNTIGTIRWYAPGEITITKIVMRIASVANDNIQVDILKTSVLQECIILNTGITKSEHVTNFKMGLDDYLTVDLSTDSNNTGRGLSIEIFYSLD